MKPSATLILSLLALAAGGCRHRARRDPRAWRWENPVPQGNLLAAACIDAGGRAYAVGAHGVVVTRDPGGAWRARRIARGDLHAVACAASGIYAVGANGVVLRSQDRGERWAPLSVATRAVLHAVAVSGRAVLVGGEGAVLLRAADGEHFSAAQGVEGAGVSALWTDGRVAVAVGPGGAVLRSEDGGARWTRVESGTQRTLAGVWGSSATDLYAVGAGGTILVSNDAGARWTVLPRTVDDDLRAVAGLGRGDVYVTGTSGLVLRARDGVQFVREDSGAPGDLLGVAVRGEEVVAVGSRGAITQREPSGRWRLLPGGHRGTLHAVWRGLDGTACAAGQGGAILCRDAALGWVPMPSGVRANLGGIASDGADVFVAVGDYGTVLRSVDRGRSWTLLPTGDRGTLEPGDTSPTWAQLPTRLNRALAAVWLSPSGEGLITGRDGIVLRTTDRGARWTRVESGIREGLFGVWGRGDGRAWACGAQGALYRSEDHGAHWTKVPTGTPHDLFAVWGDARSVWAVGRGGVVLRVDEGDRVTPQSVGGTDTLLSVSGAGRDVWIASLAGRLFHTRDRGARWGRSAVGSGDDFTAVHATADGRVSLVGYWGAILAYQ